MTYTASAFDLVDGAVPVSCDMPSGSAFPIGATTNTTTTVTCTATDAHGNKASGSFTVTVKDTTPPAISNVPTDMTVQATGPAGVVVNYPLPMATDLVDGTDSVTCAPAPGSTFPIGATTNTTTTVTCTATDAHGNTATATFHVTVVDTIPPALTLPADLSVPATSLAGAVVTYTASALDLVDGAVTPSCAPASGSTFPIGSFTVQVTYQVQGFFQPVTPSPNAPSVINWNTVKAGSTVPLKFQVFAGTDQLTSTSVVQQPLTLKQVNGSQGI